jgi:hypothetical protein
MPFALLLAQLAASTATPAQTPAPRDAVDATYGRIDGDMSVVGGLGATVGPGGARATVDMRFRYLDTVGVFTTYEDASVFASAAEPKRVIAGGLELRPLFLARWLQGKELGSPRVDLAIDSFGIELGAFFAQPTGGSLGEKPGMQLGLGLELPVLGRASGPWIGLHGGLRWSDAALSEGTVLGPVDRAGYLSVTVAWHQFFGAHAVDWDDRGPK